MIELPESLKRVECPEPVEGLCWIYILYCSNGSLYVGQAHNVQQRLIRHTNGSGARHTRLLKSFILSLFKRIRGRTLVLGVFQEYDIEPFPRH
jgi:putative endonuclease